MLYEKVIGYSPLMLDINLQSNLSVVEYLELLRNIGVRSGEWMKIDNQLKFEEIANELGLNSPNRIIDSNDYSLGSTIIASFAAFDKDFRINNSLIILEGSDSPIINEIFYQKFKFKNWSSIPIAGSSNICLVCCHPDVTDRTIFVLKTSKITNPIPISVHKNALIWISLFELNENFYLVKTEDLIKNNCSLAISLGDKNIITDKNKATLELWIHINLVSYVFGNMREYKQLLFISQNEETFILDELKIISLKYKTVFLITDGDHGMYAIQSGVIFFESAIKNFKIVNTNGAGDAAAGGFLSKYLQTSDIADSMKFSVQQASKVLTIKAGIL